MQKIATVLAILLCVAFSAGCTTSRSTAPLRTASEQLLLSAAADRAAAQLSLGIPKGTRIFVDTRAGATKEAGDIAVPLKKKVIDAKAIKGDLFDLARGKVKGRTSESQITLFKSVGTALSDLAAAQAVVSATA